MSKITYANKVALNIEPDIADINKVKDTDMNEIKSVVNQNDDNVGNLSSLSTEEKTNIVGAINELATDYIIQEGTTGSWEYRKWASGRTEAWRTYTTSIAITTQSGSIYRSSGNTLGVPTGIFISAPRIFGQIRSAFCWLANITTANPGEDFTFYLANGSSASSTSRTIDFIMEGRWK